MIFWFAFSGVIETLPGQVIHAPGPMGINYQIEQSLV
jgi:hypothetical protein